MTLTFALLSHTYTVCVLLVDQEQWKREEIALFEAAIGPTEKVKKHTHTHLHKHSSVKHCLAIVSPSLYSALASQHVTQHSFCVSVSSTISHRPTHMTCLSTLASSEGGNTTAIIIIRAVHRLSIVSFLPPFHCDAINYQITVCDASLCNLLVNSVSLSLSSFFLNCPHLFFVCQR